jgi:lipoprotein signal peptidase
MTRASFGFRTLTPAAIAALLLAGHAHQASAQEQVIKIGHSGPLSGPNAFAGKDNENGVRLAVEELNAKKIVVEGKTLKFELVSEDDQCDARTGVSVAQKLVDSGVKFVMGPYCSGVAIPASRVYNDGGAMVSTVGTNPKVTEGGYKNLFRIIASDTQIGSNMAVYAAQVLKVKQVAVIDDRTAFGQGVADQFTKVLIVGYYHLGDSTTVTSFFNIVRVHNSGAAFSFLAGASGWQRWFFTVLGFVAAGVIIWMLKSHPGQKLFSFAMACILGGAVGNVIDRLVHGYVVDFLDFHWRGMHFPAFNVADSAITVGAICLILDEFLRVKKS